MKYKDPRETVKDYFKKNEMYAMWSAVCSYDQYPYTNKLKYILYDFIDKNDIHDLEVKYGDIQPIGVKKAYREMTLEELDAEAQKIMVAKQLLG